MTLVEVYPLGYTSDVQRYDLEIYQTESGDAPFQQWLDGLKSAEVKTQIVARVRRARHGNFGDWKSLAGSHGLREMRLHSGPGFRIFYAIVGQTVILLLAGSTKSEQERTIAKARVYFDDYLRRRTP